MIVETRNLTKKFKSQIAVNSVNLHIDKGDIYGLVGKNGAGKTTLMKMIAGLSSPDDGSIKLYNSEKRAVAKHKIGALIEQPSLFLNESATENIRRYAMVSEFKGDIASEVNRVLKLVNLSNTGSKKAKNFSVGMKQRLGIAIALLGEPEILILDEPINGLDPIGIKEIRILMKQLKDQGITIFVSSHILDELARIATKYGVMREGKIIQELTSDEVESYCSNSFEIKIDIASDVEGLLDSRNVSASYFTEDNSLYLYNTTENEVKKICDILKKSSIEVREMNETIITVDQFFTNEVG